MSYVYVFVRQDIPLADQIVQVGHACLDAGCKFKSPEDNPNLVLLGLKNIEELDKARISLLSSGVSFTIFYEPDDNMGETAICTEVLEKSRLFKRWKTWNQELSLNVGKVT